MSITIDHAARRLFALFLAVTIALLFARACAQASTTIDTRPLTPGTGYGVISSTASVRSRSQKTASHPRYRANPSHRPPTRAQQFQGAVQRTYPNPLVHEPRPSALPANAPIMKPVTTSSGPQTGTERFFAGAAKVMTKSWGDNIFVWLPAISTDPNAGPTYGVLPVLVLADPTTHHIRHLVAPSYTYNRLFGQTVTGRYYFYPTDSSQFYGAGSFSQFTNRELKARYENTAALDGILYVRGETYYSVDASNRFYGLGPDSNENAETGYTAKEGVAKGSVGFNFSHSWRATFNARFRRYTTASNIIPNTTDLSARFPEVPGLGTHNTVATGATLLWDTRDSPITPQRGASGELFVEKTSVALGSDSDFVRYGMEGKRFFTYKDPKQVTVIRGLYEWENGPNLPFYERPSLGGRDTLRGYGDGRFVDRGRTVLSIEHRYTIASLGLMGIQTDFQLAPFVDVGSVFPTLPDIQAKNFHPVVGGAFRAAVKPNVVGDVEIGVGNEGPAVFVDINYPY